MTVVSMVPSLVDQMESTMVALTAHSRVVMRAAMTVVRMASTMAAMTVQLQVEKWVQMMVDSRAYSTAESREPTMAQS